MERKITDKLKMWQKQKTGRMPMLVYGARQVGKTHIISEFGRKHYVNVAYINLETNKLASSYFAENIEPERIIQFLEAETHESIMPEQTLIFLDEVQNCGRALTSLKYFNERTPEYHIICAGSLLGVAINRESYSFPVGNVDSLTLFPLDFEEFLWALGYGLLSDEIRQAFISNIGLPAAMHEQALELYRLYLIIGGMPRAIMIYRERGSLLSIPDVHNRILNDYLADMSKYATNAESVKIRAAFNSIPAQLAKDNKKFQYKLAQRGGTATIFGNAIDWLCFAGIVQKCTHITDGKMPIAVYSDLANFKIYMSDVGLLSMKSGISTSTILSSGAINNSFLGAITENYVASAFAFKQYPLFYWANNGIAELDFILQLGDEIIPIENKAGIRIRSKSLMMFMEKYQSTYAIRISSKNFGLENNIKSVPLYAVFCI